MTAVLQPLATLRAGQKATIADIRLAPPDRGRLQELGLVAGTPVEVLRFALLDDPVEIKVRGYNLTLRKHEAEQILVRVTGGNKVTSDR